MAAVRKRFPGALLQWEDFKQWNAYKLLDRYRSVLPSFNDDIQGTAAMALAGLLAGGRALGRRLGEQRIVMVGAGAAGTGIARLIRTALVREGLHGDDLLRALCLVDVDGLVVDSDVEYRRGLSWPSALATSYGLGPAKPRDLAAVVRALKPTALIGASGAPGAFTEEAVREMARHVERPLIFPLSNPTTSAEATPGDLLAWTGGGALVATGSPFGSVEFAGRTVRIGQGNNAFVFPGVGLGVLVAQAREVTDSMFAAAAETLAAAVADADLADGSLYPAMGRLRGVTAAFMWEPAYPELVSG